MAKKKLLSAILLSMLPFSFALADGAAHSTPNAISATVSVKAAIDGSGPDIVEIPVGIPLYVFWDSAPTGSTVTINIVAPDGFTISNPDFEVENAPIMFTPDQQGTYYVVVYGASDSILQIPIKALATVNVVPESAFGALAAVGAGLAAFGSVAIIKRKRA